MYNSIWQHLTNVKQQMYLHSTNQVSPETISPTQVFQQQHCVPDTHNSTATATLPYVKNEYTYNLCQTLYWQYQMSL